jgi:hypothetical protein
VAAFAKISALFFCISMVKFSIMLLISLNSWYLEEIEMDSENVSQTDIGAERQPASFTVYEAGKSDTQETQRLFLAIAAAAIAAVIGGVIWAAITKITGYQIGWMAIGVGFLVGFTVRTFGQASHWLYGMIGAIFALLGCIGGNMLAVAAITGFKDMGMIVLLLGKTFSGFDIIASILAICAGYKYATKD